ncbi:fatty acid amide hydrolase isoform X2 [Ricinus communis]|uniref:fatty acid amide hydrolase isoform X2 n=1 Tax=Ricinus communis TaxID=3988 RepID=UPI00201A7AC8|nr:fatty acid amide hydrolase isoform X2 [Ricinus communis]
MGKKRIMVPAEDVDLSTVQYKPEVIEAPHLTGLGFKLFVKLLEAPVIGSLIISHLKKENKMNEMLRNTDIPEAPMFKPEYPPQEPEPGGVVLDEDGKPEDRVEVALKCLPHYDPASFWNGDSAPSFRYWKIRDYAHAYRSKIVTPSTVAEHIISVLEEFKGKKPPTPLLISFDEEEVRKQAAASTRRFEEGNPMSILDGIFMAIKDDIDCYPHPSKGATTWMHEVRSVKKDAVSVSRLRSCGVIFVGKANMHELGMGTTGNNPNYGTTRNPHATDRYTGGSSSGPAAIVASGLCSAALGTDGGGRFCPHPFFPLWCSGLENNVWTDRYGRFIMPLWNCGNYWTNCIFSGGCHVSSPPCLPNLSSYESVGGLGSLRLGKYTEWFNDVHSTDVSDKCEDALNLLSKTHGCEIVEIVVPELEEMRTAHLVCIGSEMQSSLSPDIEDGKGVRLTYDTRTSLALFQSFSASDYVAAQCLRRRLMYHHMEIFKKVDVIVTPTTGMTAPKIPPSALKYGETDMQVTGYLMRFVIAANLLGFPAITVPVGYDKQGLPIGLQIIGRPWAEATILRLASAIEEQAEPKKQPESFYDVLQSK